MWNNSSNTTVQNHATEADNSSPSWNKAGQNNCVPVMIGHLNRYGEDLKIWGMPARMVTILAIIDEVDVASTKVNFKFRDETGSLRGVKWLDMENYDCPVKVKSYARVYGTMRKQLDENYILVASIQPMEHLNELCTHLMEVTYVCLEGENLALQAAQNHSSIQNSTSTENYNSNSSASAAFSSNAYGNLSRDQIVILDIISRGHPEDGAERSTIKAQVPPHLVPQVDGILEFLSSEGHIYTTKTDDHFKKL